ncbi:hypothetical protein QJS66_08225 [Kocuria rhizophila]|nr:hypothetical protein QJS66_08225 [Kocuria rhizophila]
MYSELHHHDRGSGAPRAPRLDLCPAHADALARARGWRIVRLEAPGWLEPRRPRRRGPGRQRG